MKHQTKKDRMDEAKAGRKYDRSKKHREKESEGMKKYFEKQEKPKRKTTKKRHSDEKEDIALIRKMVKAKDLKKR